MEKYHFNNSPENDVHELHDCDMIVDAIDDNNAWEYVNGACIRGLFTQSVNDDMFDTFRRNFAKYTGIPIELITGVAFTNHSVDFSVKTTENQNAVFKPVVDLSNFYIEEHDCAESVHLYCFLSINNHWYGAAHMARTRTKDDALKHVGDTFMSYFGPNYSGREYFAAQLARACGLRTYGCR